MSEYQYYEFQSIDRPLTDAEIAELRQLSTRATITPTYFTNYYNWSNFRGNPARLMDKYFDAFLYYANWGTHELMLRLPRRLLDLDTASLYCRGHPAVARATDDHVILAFSSDDEDGDGEDEEDSALASLIPLRADLAMGDLRCLYLAWLLCVQSEELDDDAIEPPVPPGLGNLTGPLQAFVDFLRIDEDLIAVAAQASPRLGEAGPQRDELALWIRSLPEAERDDLLLRLLEGNDLYLRAEVMRRFRRAAAAEGGAAAPPGEERRTVAELLAAAEEYATVRRRQEAERAAREREERAREAAAARAKYLDGLVGRDDDLWRQVEGLVEAKRPREYDQAVQFLLDLRDLAVRGGYGDAFAARLSSVRDRHASKRAFCQRLDRVGL